MIAPFGFHLPVDVRFGEGALGALPDVVSGLGARQPLAVVERPVADLPAVRAALAACATTVVKEPGEPGVELVDAIAVAAREADALVAIGGGSALDAAKAARTAADLGRPFRELLDGAVAPGAPGRPLVAVPTTSGTGSEVSGGAVVVDGGRKRGIASPLMRAQEASPAS